MRNSLLATAVVAELSLAPFSAVRAAGSVEHQVARFDGVSAAEIVHWREQPSTLDVRPFQFDAQALSKRSRPITIDLGVGQPLDVTPIQSQTRDGMLIWEGVLTDFAKLGKKGEIAFDPMNSVTLVNDQGRITGTIRVDGRLFKVRPLRAGGNVVIEVDESRMPVDHPAGAHMPDGPLAAALANGELDSHGRAKANTVIRVMSVATQSAISASGGITALINLAITEANQSYANSGISITLQNAGVYSTTYAESGSMSTDLARIRGTSDGYLDNVHSLRTQQTADVVMFVINNSASCGLASAIGASASTAFAAVHYDCATGYYSFGHEIGHLQAARHDPANDPSTRPYAFGHGYQQASKGWRTVMAYNCSPSCSRINYWSNPSKTYTGVAMGTTSTHDNARVLNLTRSTMAGFR